LVVCRVPGCQRASGSPATTLCRGRRRSRPGGRSCPPIRSHTVGAPMNSGLSMVSTLLSTSD
jgi:hypothetical protein